MCSKFHLSEWDPIWGLSEAHSNGQISFGSISCWLDDRFWLLSRCDACFWAPTVYKSYYLRCTAQGRRCQYYALMSAVCDLGSVLIAMDNYKTLYEVTTPSIIHIKLILKKPHYDWIEKLHWVCKKSPNTVKLYVFVNIKYSVTCLDRPPLLHTESGLSRQVACHQGLDFNTNRSPKRGLTKQVACHRRWLVIGRFDCN